MENFRLREDALLAVSDADRAFVPVATVGRVEPAFPIDHCFFFFFYHCLDQNLVAGRVVRLRQVLVTS